MEESILDIIASEQGRQCGLFRPLSNPPNIDSTWQYVSLGPILCHGILFLVSLLDPIQRHGRPSLSQAAPAAI